MVQRKEAFHHGELAAQERWGNAGLWTEDRISHLIWERIPEQLIARIEMAPFFFLATSDEHGHCDCSFKGGGAGLIKVLEANRLAFPHFQSRVKGNGAYMSLGNIMVNPNVSLLFIDFSDAARLRVNGKATIHENSPFAESFPRAECVVVVEVQQVIPGCSSDIPRLIPADPSTCVDR